MIKTICCLCLGLCLITASIVAKEHSVKPINGFIPDAETAKKVAEAVLVPIYGQSKIDGEKPLKVVLNSNIWTVTGTLHGENTVGGVAIAEISKKDGRILRISHGK